MSWGSETEDGQCLPAYVVNLTQCRNMYLKWLFQFQSLFEKLTAQLTKTLLVCTLDAFIYVGWLVEKQNVDWFPKKLKLKFLQIHFIMQIPNINMISDSPLYVPTVWSLVGPVNCLGVLPDLLVQSNLSILSCVQPHMSFSNVHGPMAKVKK